MARARALLRLKSTMKALVFLTVSLSLLAMSCGSRSVEQSPERVEHEGPTVEERLNAVVVADKMLTTIQSAVGDTQQLFGTIQNTQEGSKQLIDLNLIKQTIEQLKSSVPKQEDGRIVSRVPLQNSSPYSQAELSISTVDDKQVIDVNLQRGGESVALLSAIQNAADVQLQFEKAALTKSLETGLADIVKIPGCKIQTGQERTIDCRQIPLDLPQGLSVVVTSSHLSMKAGTSIELDTDLFQNGAKVSSQHITVGPDGQKVVNTPVPAAPAASPAQAPAPTSPAPAAPTDQKAAP